MVPHVKDVTGICRFYLMEAGERFRLYVTPVQIDPADPVMPVCTPDGYARELVDELGPFYTQGLPDDTKALDEGVFDDADYAAQADLVLHERLRQYRWELDRFRGLDRGFLFFYFNSLDQNSHMYWRNRDPASPTHATADTRHAGRIRELYRAMDGVLGEALELLDDDTVLFVVSDHGFAPYHRSVNLNDWLRENGYLVLRPGVAPADAGYLGGIDWGRTVAYGLGINGLYLNLRGRERHGTVDAGREREQLLRELVAGLEDLVDPATGARPLKQVYRSDVVYAGAYREQAPDIVLGYRRGYRGSNDSALGRITGTVFADNLKKWSGDHCMAAEEVPGVLLCSRPLAVADPTLQDMAPTILRLFGLAPPPEMHGRDVLAAGHGPHGRGT
jgi:predicted AlkP superfamily phosphohydrolase/phosphomutase